jgi:hypothetical protein
MRQILGEIFIPRNYFAFLPGYENKPKPKKQCIAPLFPSPISISRDLLRKVDIDAEPSNYSMSTFRNRSLLMEIGDGESGAMHCFLGLGLFS